VPYRELSSDATKVRVSMVEVGDHECTGGSFISCECSVGDSRIAEILEAGGFDVNVGRLHAIAQVGNARLLANGTILSLHRVRSSLGD
jgi:hypothetical protein